jgi:PilS N terminal
MHSDLDGRRLFKTMWNRAMTNKPIQPSLAARLSGIPAALLPQRGAVTIEKTAGAIIVGLIILAGGFVLIGDTFGQTKVSQAQVELNQAVLKIRSVFGAGVGNYTGLNNVGANQAGAFLGTMRRGATPDIRFLPWSTDTGCEVTIASPAQDRFTFTGNCIPNTGCSQLGANFITDTASGFISLQINGTTISPLTGAAVATACNAGDTNSMVFTFR